MWIPSHTPTTNDVKTLVFWRTLRNVTISSWLETIFNGNIFWAKFVRESKLFFLWLMIYFIWNKNFCLIITWGLILKCTKQCKILNFICLSYYLVEKLTDGKNHHSLKTQISSFKISMKIKCKVWIANPISIIATIKCFSKSKRSQLISKTM